MVISFNSLFGIPTSSSGGGAGASSSFNSLFGIPLYEPALPLYHLLTVLLTSNSLFGIHLKWVEKTKEHLYLSTPFSGFRCRWQEAAPAPR